MRPHCEPTILPSDGDFGMARPPALFERLCLGFIVWTLLHTAEAAAADQLGPAGAAPRSTLNASQALPVSAWMVPIPEPYRPSDAADPGRYSEKDFRPRTRSALGPVADPTDRQPLEPMTSSTTVWQRLSQYRSFNRVRLITLWETGGNSLSLQAGPRGGPSLQWTSRLVTRGGGPGGILDELFSTSIMNNGGRGLHWNPRNASSDAGAKAAKAAEAGLGTVTTK
jgi:hypothetical protein